MHEEYKKAATTEIKQQLAYMMIHELSVHASKEEMVWYPELVKVLGKDEQSHMLKEHTKLKEDLATLGNMRADKDEAAFDAQVAKAMADFYHHVKDEEEEELPRFLKAPGVDAIELGKKFQAAEAVAPSRPHTWAPDKAPLNLVTNAMTKPLDAIADTIRFAGNKPEVPTATGPQHAA